MTRLRQFFGTAFGVAVLGCLGLAGWALWSAGILDGAIASQVRSSSVYAAPGVELDQAAAERIIGNGINQFVDQPLEALKVVAVNYDLLVKAGTVPDGARTISPSLPRYLIAVAAVVVGATVVYLGAHRAGRIAASRRARRDAAGDARSALSAATAVLAQQIIDLDQRYTRASSSRRTFATSYRELISEYTDVLAEIAAADARGDLGNFAHLAERVESLTQRCRELAGAQAVIS